MLRLTAAVCLFGLALSGFSSAVAQAQPLTPPGPANTFTLPELDPAADPAELRKTVERLWETPIEADSNEEEQAQKIQVLRHIIAGADLLIDHATASEEIAIAGVQNKMQALGILARAGDPAAPIQAMAMAKDLVEDKRPLIAREGKLILLASQLQELPEMEAAQREKFATDLLALLSTADLTPRELEIANITATLLEQAGDSKQAGIVLLKTVELMKKSKSPAVRGQVAELEGTARRMGLPGNPMKLTGQTLAGDEFDVKDWKGKVVLVQFWASWCTYCLQEMPHIRQAYNDHHDDGFEVIGVNLDDSASRANAIIRELKLPWPNLFSSDPAGMGMENPNAKYYGITGIPQCILIDREGKVVTLQARGRNLEEELQKLFPEKN